MAFHVPNRFRIRTGDLGSEDSVGNAGAFIIKLKNGRVVFAIASDAFGWEHVSVSCLDRCPSWDVMRQIKAMFWDDEDLIVQFHPQKSEHINNHPKCLHLWRPTHEYMPRPPSILVGSKDLVE